MWMQQACGLVIILATFFEIIIIMHLYSAFRSEDTEALYYLNKCVGLIDG